MSDVNSTKIDSIKYVRGVTGSSLRDTKRALEDANWDEQAAISALIVRPTPADAVRVFALRVYSRHDLDHEPITLSMGDARAIIAHIRSGVLTEEQRKSVRDCAEMFEDQEWYNYADKLRAAFPAAFREASHD